MKSLRVQIFIILFICVATNTKIVFAKDQQNTVSDYSKADKILLQMWHELYHKKNQNYQKKKLIF